MNKEEFKSSVFTWAEKVGVSDKISSIHFRNLKSKIASCSSKGRLTFDYSILEKETTNIDEIIVHELLHLRYNNHGKIFKKMLRFYLTNS